MNGKRSGNICWITEKAKEFQKNIYFCFVGYTKDFDCVDRNKLWTVLKELGIPDHLTCLLRNLNASQEATVRTRCGIMDWFQIGKGVHQDWILSPSLFNTYENIPLKEYCILYASAIKNNEILPFVTTWMKLQSYVEWNKSDEDKYYMISVICRI